MPATRSSTDRVVPLLLAVLPLVLLRQVAAPVSDPDTFWHLVAGDRLRQTWTFVDAQVPGTFATRPWVLHQWLPELTMSWAESIGGLAAVAWWGAFVAYAALVTTHVVARSRAAALPAAVVALLAWFACGGSISPRPQVLSFVFVAIAALAAVRTGEDLRPRWWLVGLTWLWACCHGMWVLAPLLGLVTLVGVLLDGRLRGPEGRLDRGLALRLGAVPIASVLAAGVTPLGWHIYGTVGAVSPITSYIAEWQTPRITDPHSLAALALLGVAALAMSRGPTPSWVTIGLWFVAAFWSLAYVRTVGVGAMIVLPVAASGLGGLVARPDDNPTRTRPRTSRAEIGPLVLGVTLALAVAAVLLPKTAPDPARMPTALSPSLKALPPGTVVFNDYGVGGWLLWAHPDLRPVVDPRTEIYGEGWIVSVRDALDGRPGWDGFVARTGASAALVPSGSALAAALAESGWPLTRMADGFALFTPPPPSNPS